jgi:hypothetical protein
VIDFLVRAELELLIFFFGGGGGGGGWRTYVNISLDRLGRQLQIIIPSCHKHCFRGLQITFSY